MGRVPLLLASIAGGAVLFVGTSAGILAAQGRLGTLFSGAPSPESAGGRAASSPSDPHASKSEKSVAAKFGPEGPGAKFSEEKKGEQQSSTSHASDPGASETGSAAAAAAAAAAGHGEESAPTTSEAATGAKETPLLAPRGATISLARFFSLPAPVSPQELDELVTSLRDSRQQLEKLREHSASERAADDRDRLELEARTAEVAKMRELLEAEKADVTAKVAEMAKRSRELEVGEVAFVKTLTKILKEVEPDSAKSWVVELDDRLAAMVFAKLPPKTSGQLLGSLPGEKRAAILKALQVQSNAEARQTPPKESR